MPRLSCSIEFLILFIYECDCNITSFYLTRWWNFYVPFPRAESCNHQQQSCRPGIELRLYRFAVDDQIVICSTAQEDKINQIWLFSSNLGCNIHSTKNLAGRHWIGLYMSNLWTFFSCSYDSSKCLCSFFNFNLSLVLMSICLYVCNVLSESRNFS